MTRTIKFRAWNHHQKTMLYPSDVSTMPMDTSVHNHPTDITGTTYLQWTGLLDKNWKEIYEGDILNVNSNAVVEWNDEFVGFITSDRDAEKPFYNIMWATLVREGLAEVIGNVWEHPNLLNHE